MPPTRACRLSSIVIARSCGSDGAASCPRTLAEVEYGTPAMAREVIRLFAATDVRAQKHFAMGGHENGIVAFGANFEEAFAVLVRSLSAAALRRKLTCAVAGFGA